MADLAKKLAAMQKSMESAMEDYVPGGKNFDPIPSGDYTVKVTVSMTETKDSHKTMAAFIFIVAEGEHEGRQIFSNCTLEGKEPGSVNKVATHICRNFVEACGEEWPEKMKDLPGVLEKINDNEPVIQARIQAKEKDGKTNYNVYPKTDDANAPSGDDTTADGTAGDDSPASDNPVIDFCTKYGINGLDDSMTAEDIVASLKASDLTFKENEITAEEAEMLRGIEGGADIIEAKKTEPKKLARVVKGKK